MTTAYRPLPDCVEAYIARLRADAQRYRAESLDAAWSESAQSYWSGKFHAATATAFDLELIMVSRTEKDS